MSTTYFSSPQRIRTAGELAALEAAAASWAGTPFCENSRVKGVGVSCHFACSEIYMEAAWLPRVDVPEGPRDWGRSQARSLIEEWIAGSGYFILAGPSRSYAIFPGDLLGFRVGTTLHHVAIALQGGRIVHAVNGHGVVIAPCIPDAWRKRLVRIWRLK
jgi:cell wall-associated NlpC family hydrolase